MIHNHAITDLDKLRCPMEEGHREQTWLDGYDISMRLSNQNNMCGWVRPSAHGLDVSGVGGVSVESQITVGQNGERISI